MTLMDKNIVVIGGGTGNSVLLKGLKKYTDNICAIVTVADDGGSTGKLRKELGILAVGDIRNCITALADDEDTMTKLMEHRFSRGELKNHSFGNLFLAALNEISDSFPLAIKGLSDVLKITGEVVCVTKENIDLCAKLENGKFIYGESQIPKKVISFNSKIDKLYLNPKNVKANDYAIEKIKCADIIVISPGSLYTSILPNLLVDGISRAISENKDAKKYYLANIMTQSGETDNFSVSDHIRVIEKHCYYKVFDTCVYSNSVIRENIIENYREENAGVVKEEIDEDLRDRYDFVGLDLALETDGMIRHDSEKFIEFISESE